MKKMKSLPILFIFTLGLFVSHSAGTTAVGQAKNDKAPPFMLNLLNGGELQSSDLTGKVAVLKFVSSY